jgi:DnaJ-class molecular chaperone
VLGDPEKKRVYDQLGEEGLQGGPRIDPRNIFASFFQNINGELKKTAAAFQHTLRITFEDSFTGTVRKLLIKRDRVCRGCGGRGCTDPQALRICPQCKGQKYIRQNALFPRTPCTLCMETGTVFAREAACATCRGERFYKDSKTLEVNIAPGTKDGDIIRFPGESDEVPGSPPGDVSVIVRVEQHPMFERSDLDVVMRMDISLVDALCGFRHRFKYIDGKYYEISTSKTEIIKPGDTRSVPQMGFKRTGALVIRFNVVFPEMLDPVMKEEIGKTLRAAGMFSLTDTEAPSATNLMMYPYTPNKKQTGCAQQ